MLILLNSAENWVSYYLPVQVGKSVLWEKKLYISLLRCILYILYTMHTGGKHNIPKNVRAEYFDFLIPFFKKGICTFNVVLNIFYLSGSKYCCWVNRVNFHANFDLLLAENWDIRPDVDIFFWMTVMFPKQYQITNSAILSSFKTRIWLKWDKPKN